mgnify:CR=1 FL=1
MWLELLDERDRRRIALDDPSDPLWRNAQLDVDSRESMLALSAEEAYDELSALQGTDVARWNWGDLHAITLRSDTFGSSGIAPIEALFAALTRRGFPTTNHRTPGGHDPAMWRHGIIPALAELLG